MASKLQLWLANVSNACDVSLSHLEKHVTSVPCERNDAIVMRSHWAWEELLAVKNTLELLSAKIEEELADESGTALGTKRELSAEAKSQVFETMTRYVAQGMIVRVWRDETEEVLARRAKGEVGAVAMGPDQLVWTTFNSYYKSSAFALEGVEGLFHAIYKLSRINAVEILNENGDGGLYYKNWP